MSERIKYLKPRNRPLSLYSIEGPWDIKDPVHENLALAALYQAQGALNLEYADFSNLWVDPSLNEFLRGVFWNDDPAVLMFDTVYFWQDNNFSSGADWGIAFEAGKSATSNDLSNLTGRSHFWDMQFLHGMACVPGEAAVLTRYRALMWAEFMYKVAIGQPVVAGGGPITTPATVASTQLQNVAIPSNPQAYDPSGTYTERISGYFTSASAPTGMQTINNLLNKNDLFVALDLGKRAIGSVMHLIQDSFARGHTRRALLNPQDVVDNNRAKITFAPNTYGQWGSVITFHTYRGQNETQHGAFDLNTSGVPLDPTNPASFNEIVGGRDAITYCTQLLLYYANKTPWESGPRALLESIFTLDGNATPADTEVNLTSLPVVSTGLSAVGTTDPNYFVISNSQSAPAYVVPKDPEWIGPMSSAQWISPSLNTQGAAGATWAYRIEFHVPADADPKGVSIVGQCAGDDACIGIHVNDKPVATPFFAQTDSDGHHPTLTGTGPTYTAFATFRLRGADGFVAGYNYIDFFVNNVNGPTGLIVDIRSATVTLALAD